MLAKPAWPTTILRKTRQARYLGEWHERPENRKRIPRSAPINEWIPITYSYKNTFKCLSKKTCQTHSLMVGKQDVLFTCVNTPVACCQNIWQVIVLHLCIDWGKTHEKTEMRLCMPNTNAKQHSISDVRHLYLCNEQCTVSPPGILPGSTCPSG
jgi:hypothetical protein